MREVNKATIEILPLGNIIFFCITTKILWGIKFGVKKFHIS
ncbi:unnamed protein product [Acanthoscelides obtectus]|uniref:Uncharacterized protein n=1 Tax=Acanthoscelides obtectus TaxID=200917 RepID=A0A9P0PH20_ACAOB|nr:unnamed protein product [Acanthoscelides obtectus]CAK1666402.1 hypothetical protein AOBTE_LOCUS25308 [Acanthoscelides obtectus]